MGWEGEEGDPCSRTDIGELRDSIWQLLGARMVGGALLRKLELLLKKPRGREHLFDGSRSVYVGL